MIKTITRYDFEDEFIKMNRKDQFTYEGKKALFEYLEEYEESTSEQIELDVIALCCDYTEYESFKDLQDNYSNIKDMEDLENNTQVIHIDGSDSLIIANF